MKKTIYQLREEVEAALREAVADLSSQKGRGTPASRSTQDRVIVTVSTANTLNVMVVSRVFEGFSFEERNNSLWTALERRFTKPELERVDRWDMLTLNEAKKVYPSTLKPRSPLVEVAS